LRRKDHCNKYLQRSVNKYGINGVKIEPIEFCEDFELLRKREQHWIDFYDSKNPDKGFNLVKMVEKNGTTGYKFTRKQRKRISEVNRKRMSSKIERQKISDTIVKNILENPNRYGGFFIPKEFILFSPKGERIIIYNLSQFCRDNDLSYPAMLKVHEGHVVEHNGWKRNLERKNLIKKHFKFINPEGRTIEVLGLRRFCLKNGLHYKTMCNIHRGIGASCQGWRKYYQDGKMVKRAGKLFKLKQPDGEIVIGNNFKLFCKENRLTYETLRKGFQSNGWKLVK
jgi:hypothetical protein